MKRVAVLAALGIALAGSWLAFRPRLAPAPAGHRDVPLVAAPPIAPAPERADTVLEARLRAIAVRGPGLVAIAARDLGTGAVARVNADSLVPLMSVVKLPVALAVLDGVDRGRWSLATPVTLLPHDMHPRGFLGDRYPHGGGPVSVHYLVAVMITHSDNSAADALMRLIGGPPAVTAWLVEHGIRDLRVDRTERALGNDWYGLAAGADTMGSAEAIRELRARVPGAAHDSAAAAMLRDPRDTGTAEACERLIERLWRGALLSPAMTDTLTAILGRSKTAPHRMPAMLPRGTPVARKTGTGGTAGGVTIAINDVGVIRMPDGGQVAIAVLVKAPHGPVPRAERTIARVARAVYDAWSPPAAGTEVSAPVPSQASAAPPRASRERSRRR